jgi:branched-chain amino acid transport system substrate-binding protein
MKKRLALFLAALLAVVAFSASAPSASSGQAEPYDLYALLPLTGPAAFLGKGEAPTLQAAEKYVNAHGGIRGRPLHVIIEDDQSNAATAVSLASQVIAKKVAVFVGPAFGAPCTAVAPLVQANGPVMYCLSSNLYPPKDSYAFVFMLTNVDQAANLLRYAKAKGARTIAFLSATDTTGQDNEKGALDALKEPDLRDLKIVASEHFGVTDISVVAQMTRIKASGADAIGIWTTGTAFGTALRGMQDVGYNGMVVTGAGNAIKEQLAQYDAFLPSKMFFTTLPYQMDVGWPDSVRKARAVFLDAMREVGITEPNVPNAVPWDPMMIVVQALQKNGPNATAEQVRQYILGLHGYPGINGFYDFRRGDQRGLDPRSTGAMTWDKAAGKTVVVSRPGGAPL